MTGHNSQRQRIWDAIRCFSDAAKPFGISDLVRPGELTTRTVEVYLNALVKAGYLAATSEPVTTGNCHDRLIFRCLTWSCATAPRLDDEGREITQGDWQEDIWRCIRPLGQCTVQDVVVHATTPRHQMKGGEVRRYLNALVNAGFLTCLKGYYTVIPGVCTGPAPQLRRVAQVVHRGKVVWTGGGDD
ncbi:MAG: hypothetical protein AUJ55_07080 [Proteobacteria bacterium CG1_02_64_396]|nr:MAG: hypothetical protein AUJ55_07080 [Proteobacteria bacterium CG1_02_64_396]